MTHALSMKAAVVEHMGAPFQRMSVARPVPRVGEVLVRIMASGVNPLDLKIRSGGAEHARHPLPAILGIDMAGVVDALGPGVTAFNVGDEVYGMTGGAGGVGTMAVQIARAFNATVFATASAANASVIEPLGATPIDYGATPVERYIDAYTAGRGFDLVYDTVGGVSLDASFKAVTRFGHVVSSLGWGTHALAPLSFRAATYSGVFTLLPLLTGEGRAHHGDILREATRLADAGRLKPVLDSHRFDLDDVGAAHALLETRQAQGKVVVTVQS